MKTEPQKMAEALMDVLGPRLVARGHSPELLTKAIAKGLEKALADSPHAPPSVDRYREMVTAAVAAAPISAVARDKPRLEARTAGHYAPGGNAIYVAAGVVAPLMAVIYGWPWAAVAYGLAGLAALACIGRARA